MNWIVANIKWIMLVSGMLTSTMIYVAIAPQTALRALFGEALDGPLAEIIVRSWGVLIALVGAMLIYGAFSPASRPLVLTVAGVSKLAFIGLVLTYGMQFLGQQVRVAMGIDLVMIVLFIVYLIRWGQFRSITRK